MGLWEFIFFIIGCHVVGVIAIAKFLQFIMFLYHYFIGHSFSCNQKLSSYGRWCLITGCTDGIGRAYAFALAKRGHSLLLVSRNQEKLKNLSEELEKKYATDIKILAVDFTDDGPDNYKRVEEFIKDVEVGILINNVGMTTSKRSIFTEIQDRNKFIKDIINVNVTAMTMMTSIILPQMEERQNGLILNISSISAMMPLPIVSMYGATKAFVDYLSQALHIEYKSKGIYIQSVLPGYVSTKMSEQKQSWSSPSPDDYVEAQLRTIGRNRQTFGYYAHSFTAFLMRIPNIFPTFIRYPLLLKSLKER